VPMPLTLAKAAVEVGPVVRVGSHRTAMQPALDLAPEACEPIHHGDTSERKISQMRQGVIRVLTFGGRRDERSAIAYTQCDG
jgi:hypothetical protein